MGNQLKQIVNILWTGGLDSTCRLAELYQQSVIIQPYYLIDPQRHSTKYEIAAMDKIRQLLLQDKRTVFELLPTKYIDIREIPANEDITKSYHSLQKKYGVGIQYEWLARYARQQGLLFETCFEKGPLRGAMEAIVKECRLMNGYPGVYVIDPSYSSKEAYYLFGNLCFPSSLWNMTKKQEVDEMRKMGLEEVMKHTWFCHHPVFGLTCGHCHPCKDVILEGMIWRISKIGYVLGGCRKIVNKVGALFRKIA